ncbi:Detected protein of confused Function [Hibiscus syriacus]|uniref:Detected protein of confused Function n=1 Tax=Hibiscus syriacus TaxID=106335 RepID=A0A6A3BWU1_HIBSY|nr:Detected protein of confused Function [Hibiscus syriacus]
MTANTTTPGYWFNWRVLLCALWVLFTAIVSLIMIWKCEGLRKPNQDGEETQQDTKGSLHEDEPGGHMEAAFSTIILSKLSFSLGAKFDLSTWTFTLITIYFGLGSLLSIRGCYQYHKRVSGDKVDNVELDAEQGNHAGAASGETSINAGKIISPEPPEGHLVRQRAGTWGYVFQIIFQMNAGAVLLTDCVFWFIIVPFLAIKDYNLSVLAINMHTINAVFLLGDTALNCLRFPCFRIAYFFLWTVIYVIFQWLVHACLNIWWPYPFLDLSSSYAPLCIDAFPMLWRLCFSAKAETPCVFKMVPRVLPVCELSSPLHPPPSNSLQSPPSTSPLQLSSPLYPPPYASLQAPSSTSPLQLSSPLHLPLSTSLQSLPSTSPLQLSSPLRSTSSSPLPPHPPSLPTVRNSHSMKTGGTFDRYKARLAVKGYSQVVGSDFKETFNLVVRSSTVRTVLATAVLSKWTVRHIDINNAFLNELIFFEQRANGEELFCLLKKALYGLRQAPRACSKLLLIMYVDDIVVTGSNPAEINMYIIHFLVKGDMLGCTSAPTPMVISTKLKSNDRDVFTNVHLYRSIVGMATGRVRAGYWSRPIPFKNPSPLLKNTGFKWGSPSDWTASVDDRRSTNGYCVYLGGNLITWCSKKQSVVSKSPSEAEYRSFANPVAELIWVEELLGEIGVDLHGKPVCVV